MIIINVQELFFAWRHQREKQFSFRSTSPPLSLTLKNFEMRAPEVCLVAATLKSDYLKKKNIIAKLDETSNLEKFDL